MTSRIRSCYIAAPAGSNLDTLRRALQERGIRVAVPDERASPSSWSSGITKVLSEVDLFIGVLTRERRSDWTLFELGLAWASGRQVLLLAPVKGSTPLGSDLKGVLTVRTSLANREAIGFALDQLLAAPERGIRDEPQSRPLKGLGDRADAFLLEVRDALAARQGSQLERVVERALRESGVEALSTQPTHDQGVDLAVWSDALQPTLGNPLLIEVKTRIAGREDSRRAASELSRQITSSGTQWGLLVYGQGPTSKALQQSMPPNVLAISLDELFERMREEPFAGIVNDLRNRRVHGVDD